MPDFSVTVVIAIAFTFLLAGFVKGVIGLGLPTIAVGLLSLAMSPAQAAAILIVPSVITNLWQMFGPRFRPLIQRLWPLLAGICLGTWAGSGLLSGGNSARAAVALGVALVIYAGLGLVSVRFTVSPQAERWLSLPVGAVTGFITAATGVFVIPAVPYLQALGLDKEDLVQALGISFMVSTIALAVDLQQGGALQGAMVGVSLLALAPALLGMFAGQVLRRRVQANVFRVCFFAGLLGLGLHLASRGFF